LTPAYTKINRNTIDELIAIVGSENVSTDNYEIEGYSSDEMAFSKPHAPEVIVKPVDSASISKLMHFADNKRIPVTPRGAGTGVSGGCIPIFGGILLSLERLNHILEINRDNSTAIVEAGVTLEELHTAVEQQGLYFPIHLGDMSATIGGNIATNAGGMNAVKYGVIRHQVLGLEAVIPNGDIIKTGGQFVKCSTGYDLTQLLTGSEGTLAIITKVILRLNNRMTKREVLFVPFNNLQDAIDSVPDILQLTTTPIGLEFMERSIIEIVEKHLNIELPYHEYEAFLMILMEGESEDEITEYFSAVEMICKNHGAIDATMPNSERAKRRLLNARENFYNALRKFAPVELIDVVVPRNEIAKFVRTVKEISQKYEIPVIVYGHAGDGNVHLHPVCIDMDLNEWQKRLPGLMKEIYHAGSSFGGAISGEHGIGFGKKLYLINEIDQGSLYVMKEIKKAFDPNNILNPGKIFDM